MLVFSSCQAATANANPLTEDTQSVTSEYTLEEFRQKIQPEIIELLQNQIDYNSDWQDKVGENYIEYNRNGADEYTAATVNDYIEKILATKNDYLEIWMGRYKVVTADSEFIQRVAKLLDSLEFEEISETEFKSLVYPDIISTHMQYFLSATLSFYGSTSFYGANLEIIEDTPSDNMLESDYYFSCFGLYFKISNLEEIKDEFYEVYGICSYACVGETDRNKVFGGSY